MNGINELMMIMPRITLRTLTVSSVPHCSARMGVSTYSSRSRASAWFTLTVRGRPLYFLPVEP
jgi:hypothetical protein